MAENPYKTPLRENEVDEVDDQSVDFTISADSLETLAFTGKIVRGVSAICGIGSVIHFAITIFGFTFLVEYEWSWLHTIQAFRLMYFPVMALLCVFGWRYANAISQLTSQKVADPEKLINAQGYFWLIVALLVFVFLCGVALAFSASYAYSNGDFY